jgi:hypothetical protein
LQLLDLPSLRRALGVPSSRATRTPTRSPSSYAALPGVTDTFAKPAWFAWMRRPEPLETKRHAAIPARQRQPAADRDHEARHDAPSANNEETPMDKNNPADEAPIDTRAAGLLLGLAAVTSIVFVMLDPEVVETTSRAILQGVAAAAPTHRVVHAVELACVAGLGFGFASLAQRVGLRRPAVLAACLAYLMGCIAMLVAAVTDGFITGDVASYFLLPGHSVDTGREMLHVCYIVIQDFATASWFFQSVGVLALAWSLLPSPGLQRAVGWVGLATGALPPIAILATYPAMDGSVVIGILLAQLVWNVAAATLLIRRGAARPGTALLQAIQIG